MCHLLIFLHSVSKTNLAMFIQRSPYWVPVFSQIHIINDLQNICTHVSSLSTRSFRLSCFCCCAGLLLGCFILYFARMCAASQSFFSWYVTQKGTLFTTFNPIFYSYVHVVCLFWQRFARCHPQRDYFIYRTDGWTFFIFYCIFIFFYINNAKSVRSVAISGTCLIALNLKIKWCFGVFFVLLVCRLKTRHIFKY